MLQILSDWAANHYFLAKDVKKMIKNHIIIKCQGGFLSVAQM